MDWHRSMHVLLIDDEWSEESAVGAALRNLVASLAGAEIETVTATSYEDGWQRFVADPEIACVLLDWDLSERHADGRALAEVLVHRMRERSHEVPILLTTDRLGVEGIPAHVLDAIDGYIWLTEDTVSLMAARIERQMENYVDALLPPFFGALTEYAAEYRYAWHTPGHMGGMAFLKSPAGRRFFDFFGENVFRADLSVSVPELGSLMEHSGVVGDAELQAARAFGADQTYFVLNGTSTANKMVWCGRVRPGDVVLVDRNCHKSLQHAIQMTGAVPVYLVPTRNRHGIIGPVSIDQFAEDSVREKLRESPLVDGEGPERLAMTVLTNSTYDGLCYDAEAVERNMRGLTWNLHFDEAWYGYAAFHEIYGGRYGMHDTTPHEDAPVILATQSTHKLLAAFSQCSMLHIRDRHLPESRHVDHERFNESFMMHTSTSPQYNLIASLDVATRMMQHGQGRGLMQDAIEEAITFRRKMVEIGRTTEEESGGWWYRMFQPKGIENYNFSYSSGPLSQADSDRQDLTADRDFWMLKSGEDWHGYGDLANGFVMLDPIKVTIMMPGLAENGDWEDRGVPAVLASLFLRKHGVVVEKTGDYAFLVLFSIGISRGKSGTLMAELFRFKELCDANAPIDEVFPELAKEFPEHYMNSGIMDLATDMHGFLRDADAARVSADVYGALPEQAITPGDAFHRLIGGEADRIPLDDAHGRIAATMIVPYPPGIPVIMPGERYDVQRTPLLLEFLQLLEHFDNSFPGFEHEVHGAQPLRDHETGKIHYHVDVIKE